jgi:nicotinamide riboside transporter PnuC
MRNNGRNTIRDVIIVGATLNIGGLLFNLGGYPKNFSGPILDAITCLSLVIVGCLAKIKVVRHLLLVSFLVWAITDLLSLILYAMKGDTYLFEHINGIGFILFHSGTWLIGDMVKALLAALVSVLILKRINRDCQPEQEYAQPMPGSGDLKPSPKA